MSNKTREIWKKADAVCFDVDSTVIQEEGIDELAKFLNKGTEITNLTKQAMSGSMTFRESLTVRLNIINPTLQQIKFFISQHPPLLTPGIKELIDILHKRNVPVFLITGGFRCIIEPIAKEINIPFDKIFANKIKFYFSGEYAGFDETAPTSESGGKGVVIDELKKKFGYKNLVMIGDGATDLETCPPADAFIGFGGNVVREQVKSKSDWFVMDFKTLIDALEE